MKVINLFGGPGSGKSTIAAQTFAELKNLGYNCELVREYAKDLTWEKNMTVLDNQIFIFANQHHRQWILKNQVDFLITDSPLILSLVYGNTSSEFQKFVLSEFNRFNNINIMLKRVHSFNQVGRNEDEETCKKLDVTIKETLINNNLNIDLYTNGNKEAISDILKTITK